jgi:hypothetical protein
MKGLDEMKVCVSSKPPHKFVIDLHFCKEEHGGAVNAVKSMPYCSDF